MNDYFAGSLARERQADYLREVERDELAAQVHRAQLDGDAPAPPPARVAYRRQRRIWSLLERLRPAQLADRARRP